MNSTLDSVGALMQFLNDEHLAMLRASAINDDVIDARQYQSLEAKEGIEYDFAPWQCASSGLLVPLWGMNREIVDYQIKNDTPRIDKRGKPVKYESRWKMSNVLDINPLMWPEVRAGGGGIFITEGAKKGDALASQGCPAISLKGVWGWKGKNDYKGTTALGDWDDVNIRGSKFVIIFDSDIVTNKGVNYAVIRLKQFLIYRKAHWVKIVKLPQLGDGKTGVDDYLASIQKEECR